MDAPMEAGRLPGGWPKRERPELAVAMAASIALDAPLEEILVRGQLLLLFI